jgi:hypothetical protein
VAHELGHVLGYPDHYQHDLMDYYLTPGERFLPGGFDLGGNGAGETVAEVAAPALVKSQPQPTITPAAVRSFLSGSHLPAQLDAATVPTNTPSKTESRQGATELEVAIAFTLLGEGARAVGAGAMTDSVPPMTGSSEQISSQLLAAVMRLDYQPAAPILGGSHDDTALARELDMLGNLFPNQIDAKVPFLDAPNALRE